MQIADVGFFSEANGGGTNILGSGVSTAIAFGAIIPDSNYPGAEAPGNILDGDSNTKYLNFGGVNSGFIVTPAAGSSTVRGMEITTANDAPGRDPSSFRIYGTNDPISSADNSQGDAETWTLIDSGSLTLPEDRFTSSGIIGIDNDTAYDTYKVVFDGLDGDTLMQIGDFQFHDVPEPSSAILTLLGALGLLRRRR